MGSTSNPVHHDQHSSPAQHVTVAPTSGKAYIIPGTEPRAMPGIYKQEYMQPVYSTSNPVHHDQLPDITMPQLSVAMAILPLLPSMPQLSVAMAILPLLLSTLQLSVAMGMLPLLQSVMDILMLRLSAMIILPFLLAMDILLLRSSAMIILPRMLAMDMKSPLRLAMVILLYTSS